MPFRLFSALCVLVCACDAVPSPVFEVVRQRLEEPPKAGCDARETFARGRLAARQAGALAVPLAAPAKDVYIFAESHYLTRFGKDDVYIPLLAKLKQKLDIDCLYLEAPAVGQASTDKYLHLEDIEFEDVDQDSDYRVNWDLAERAFDDLELRVRLVDADLSRSRLLTPEGMDLRNKTMAEQIVASECKRGALITGVFHAAAIEDYKGVQHYLAKKGRSAHVINIEHVDEAFDRTTHDRPAGSTFDKPDVCDWSMRSDAFPGEWSFAIPKDATEAWVHEKVADGHTPVPWTTFDSYALMRSKR